MATEEQDLQSPDLAKPQPTLRREIELMIAKLDDETELHERMAEHCEQIATGLQMILSRYPDE